MFQSVDVHIARRDDAAVAADDYLAVLGDMHLGSNPPMRGVFTASGRPRAENVRIRFTEMLPTSEQSETTTASATSRSFGLLPYATADAVESLARLVALLSPQSYGDSV